MSFGYSTNTCFVEMPTKRSKRYVAWRTGQSAARKYNRADKPKTVKPEITVVAMERVAIAIDEIILHNCNGCGRSEFMTRAEFREIHNGH